MVSMGRHGPLQWGFHQVSGENSRLCGFPDLRFPSGNPENWSFQWLTHFECFGNWRKMVIQSTERCGDTYGFKLCVLCGDWWFIYVYLLYKKKAIFHCDAFTRERGTMHVLKTNQHFAGLWFLHGWTWGRLVTDVTESRFWTMDMWVCLKILGKILFTCDGESKLCKTM